MIFNGLSGKIGHDLLKFYANKKFNFDYFELNLNEKPKSNTIVHMAACSNVSTSENIISSNIDYLLNIIDYTKKYNIENFIFFSSLSIYGNPNGIIDENSPFYAPNIYGISKYLGEEMLKQSGIKNVLCIRLPAVLTSKPNSSFLFKWLQNIQNGENININNIANKFNNFISINCLFDFIFNVQFNGFNTINLASKDDFTFDEFATYLIEKYNSRSKINNIGASSFFKININKAIANFNFNPYSAKDSIDEWIRNINV